jgi:plasmid stabilization system protein ParE
MLIRWTMPAAADLTHICDYTESRFGAAQARRAARLLYEELAQNGVRHETVSETSGGARRTLCASMTQPTV